MRKARQDIVGLLALLAVFAMAVALELAQR
jgi:hypothetical protein